MFLKENAPIALKHDWSGRALETMVRMTHFMALLIQHLSKPGQNVYWVSDEDDIFAGDARKSDLISMLGMWTGLHADFPLGELAAGTTGIDSGDRFEEDLASIPDLIAGATREYVNAVADLSGGRIHAGVAMEFPTDLSQKSDDIIEWSMYPSALRHLTLLFERGSKGGLALSTVTLA